MSLAHIRTGKHGPRAGDAHRVPADDARGDGARAAGTSSTSSSSPATRTSITRRSGRCSSRASSRGAASGSASSRSRDWDSPDDIARMGAPAPLRRRHRRQPRLDAQQAHRAEEDALARISTRPAAAPTCARTARRSSTRTCAAQAFPGVPDRARRHRGVAPPHRALRLLVATQVRRSILLDAKADLLVFGMGERAGVGDRAPPRRGRARSRSSRDMRGTAHVKKNRREWEPIARRAEPLRHRRQDRRAAVVRGGRDRQDGVRARCRAPFQYETNPHNGAPAPAAARRRGGVLQPARAAARRERRWTGSTICRSSARRTRATRERDPRVRDGEALDRDDARLLRRLHLLQHHRARRAHHPEPLSEASVLREVRALSRMDDFRGDHHRSRRPDREHVQDGAARTSETESACRRLSCVHPGICENLDTDHGPLIDLMKKVREEKGIKQRLHRVAACATTSPSAAPSSSRELAQHHTGGQLSVAPEHNDPDVLDKMKKPGIESYERFARRSARRARRRARSSTSSRTSSPATPARRWRTRSSSRST